ncbi:hypothetical protein [Granulicella sp. L60]|uniref:hypothetical protein n=1 Tax=Granulicella sp. L60 TaxID=1641866 RepID=UPI00131B3866|nr:hypothetical protein [Granulicella sp. L60]
MLTNKTFGLATAFLMLWLVAWIFLSWAGVQDDAFIHLRYASNLLQTHLISYDGVHANYGASSLLYVYLLSLLRIFSHSPNLPRFVSSFVHLLLIVGIAIFFLRSVPRESTQVRALGLILMLVLVAPSSVRWLDDGMETGLVLCFVASICWITSRQSSLDEIALPQYMACVVLGFFAVLLRLELILLCGVALAILAWKGLFAPAGSGKMGRRFWRVLSGSHLFLGGLLALLYIQIKMHFIVPDTALAKSTGVASWHYAFYATSEILAGSLSFGSGMFLLWFLTIFLLARAGRFSMTSLFANLVFPVLFALAAVRGQQIQGARYFVWAIFFSTLWNILEMTKSLPTLSANRWDSRLVYCFLALLLIAMPFESRAMYPMLRDRSTLLTSFEGDHLKHFEGKRGVAYDIGYLGYFTGANICDVAGLVNGRDKARMTSDARTAACFADHPDFMFLDQAWITTAGNYIPLKDWQICSRYDFRNVNSTDRHFLLVPRSTADEVCREVANSVPMDVQQSSQ